MLRLALIVGSGALLAASIAALLAGGAVAGGPMMAFWALVTFLGVLFERSTYKPLLDAPPGADWLATREKFIDPGTGAPVVVYEHPLTGKRAYVKA